MKSVEKVAAFTLEVKAHSATINKAAKAPPGTHLGFVSERVNNMFFIGFLTEVWALVGCSMRSMFSVMAAETRQPRTA